MQDLINIVNTEQYKTLQFKFETSLQRCQAQ